MERRDYLLDDIQRTGRVLAELLSRLMGRQAKGVVVVEAAAQTLQNELGWDLEASLALPETEFIPHLTQDKGLDEQQLGMLAELLEGLGDALDTTEEREVQCRYYARALHIHDFLLHNARLYAFDRPARIARLMAALSLDV